MPTKHFFQLYCFNTLYHGENKLIFNEMMMRSALTRPTHLVRFFIVLADWNNSLQIDMSPHSNTLFLFQANLIKIRTLHWLPIFYWLFTSRFVGNLKTESTGMLLFSELEVRMNICFSIVLNKHIGSAMDS